MTIFNQNKHILLVYSNFTPIFASDYNHTYMEVKTIIKQKGFTIEAVAKKMGITRVTLTQNLSRNPTVGTLQKIADVIGCKVGDFFADDMDIKDDDNTITCPHCGKKIKIEKGE